MLATTLRWGFFTVLVSTVPLVIAGLISWGDSRFALASLVRHGELLLITVAIGADAIGEMIPTGERGVSAKIALTGIVVVLLIVAALWYAVLQVHQVPAEKVLTSSSLIFVATLISSLGCRLLAKALP